MIMSLICFYIWLRSITSWFCISVIKISKQKWIWYTVRVVVDQIWCLQVVRLLQCRLFSEDIFHMSLSYLAIHNNFVSQRSLLGWYHCSSPFLCCSWLEISQQHCLTYFENSGDLLPTSCLVASDALCDTQGWIKDNLILGNLSSSNSASTLPVTKWGVAL